MLKSSKQLKIGHLAKELQKKIYPLQDDDSASRITSLFAIEGLLVAVVVNLATAYTTMFATRMGASSSQVGLIISLPQMLAMVILIPGALLAGKMTDRRRPVEIAVVLSGVFYGLAGFSPFMGNARVWFLIGMVSLANVPVALYNATWQNYFSDIVPPHERNSVYTMRTSMTFFAGIITVQLIGVLLGNASSEALRIWLYQGCYWLTFLVTLLQFRVLRRSPADVGKKVTASWRDLGAAISEMVHCRRLLAFLGISMLFHFGWYMAWPLFFLTEVTYLGANESWLSYIAVSASVLQWLSVRPWGRFIEKKGIRLALVIGCLGLTTNPLFAILSAYFPVNLQLPGMLVMNLVNSCTYGAFQLSILQCLLEAVPPRYKALNLSIYTTALLIVYALGPIFGVQLYNTLGANLLAMTQTMVFSSLLRLVGTLLFFWRWYKLRSQPDCGIRT